MSITITSFPSLTTSWMPASSCVASTGFWYVVYGKNVVFSDMFGMPSVTNIGQESSPTGGCVPPSYTLSVPYLTDGDCPKSYFKACSSATSYDGRSADHIMCCPSVSGWNFNCAPATNVGAAPYGCLATFTTGAKITGSRTDLIVGTGQAETHTVGGDTGVNAWGIALLSTTPLTSSATITSAAATTSDAVVSVPSSAISTAPSTGSAPTSTSSSASGLSTGASIGIGVGVGVGALSIIGLLAFCIIGRRRNVRQQQRQQQKPMVQDSYDHNGVIHNGQYYYGGLEAASHGTKMQQPNERALQSEAPTHVDPYEMQG